LAEGGLLQRVNFHEAEPKQTPCESNALVSALIPITSQKEQDWLGDCVSSLFAQTHERLEILVVDNATDFGLDEWLKTNYPRTGIVRLERRSPYAVALNRGVSRARGSFFLLLNPDLKLGPTAVAQMVKEAESDSRCAAVAAKLKFWWAPRFLNGLGNRVRDFAWGTDNAIGHLDLGQFDHWKEVPSACFAATLVPRDVWAEVGAIDEGFPAYYEDTDWCYRSRLLGYSVRVAPQAEVFHVFGGWHREPGEASSLTPRKLRNAAYGRMRFAAKIVGPAAVRRFLGNYFREDVRNLTSAIKRFDRAEAAAYVLAWWDFLAHYREIRRHRRKLQSSRECSDEVLFGREEDMPPLLCWFDLPELTLENVARIYLPHIQAKRTRPIPEFETIGHPWTRLG
jgi:GT2 family glycosyltransferase